MIEKEFTLFWLDGSQENVKGTSIANAFARAGYGGGAFNALDYYAETFESKVRSFHAEGDSAEEIAELLNVGITEVENVLNEMEGD